MGGIMRAPSLGVHFVIPYSGTHQNGDCILVADVAGNASMAANYVAGTWSLDYHTTNFSDENNVISFNTNYIDGYGYAAFIPGPKHV